MSNKIMAWYFSDGTRRLRYGDGRVIALGVEHTVKGYPEPCKHGLHGSESILDALRYAPGTIIWRVELSGRIKRGNGKVAATRRRYVAGGIDVSDTLRSFAYDQALSVSHLWDMPMVVREYLETMDESKRNAAVAASCAAWADSCAARAAARAASSDSYMAAGWASMASASAASDTALAAVSYAANAAGATSEASLDAAIASAMDAAEKHLLKLIKERHGIE